MAVLTLSHMPDHRRVRDEGEGLQDSKVHVMLNCDHIALGVL